LCQLGTSSHRPLLASEPAGSGPAPAQVEQLDRPAVRTEATGADVIRELIVGVDSAVRTDDGVALAVRVQVEEIDSLLPRVARDSGDREVCAPLAGSRRARKPECVCGAA